MQVVVSVQYQVIKENLYDAFYKLTDSRSQITSYVFDVVRATVPKIYLDDVFTTKDEIALGKHFLRFCVCHIHERQICNPSNDKYLPSSCIRPHI